MSTEEKQKQQEQEQCKDQVIDGQLKALIEKYLKLERIILHKELVERLVKENDSKQLETLVGRRLNFGTAGIRGRMGPGFGQMNDLVIIQTSQGLASYFLETDSSVPMLKLSEDLEQQDHMVDLVNKTINTFRTEYIKKFNLTSEALKMQS